MRVDERADRLRNLPPEKRQILLKMLREEAGRARTANAIPRRAGGGPAPLSFAQQRLWFLDRLAPGNPAYNIPFAARLLGPLDVRALEGALKEIARRHEVLRARFVEIDGQPAQVISPGPGLPLPRVDLAVLAPERSAAEARRLAGEEALRPFDLAVGPLLRAVLVRLAPGEHAVLFIVHHAVSDAWSTANLLRELAALYEAFAAGRPSPLPELPVQYADFAAWQREWLQGERLATELAWWRERLAGAPALLELPADRPRPAIQSFRGALRSAVLDAGLVRSLEGLCREAGATLFMALLAAFQALLSRWTGQTDGVVGSPVANRTRPELEPLIGFFVNMLVLRADLSGNPTFRQVLAQVAETTLGAYDHQDLPFERLLDELGPARSLSHNPLFQVAFVLQNAPAETASGLGEGLVLKPLEREVATAPFDLTLTLIQAGGRLEAEAQYSTDLFDATTIDRLLAAYERLLRGIAADPDARIRELPLQGEAQRHQLVREWAGAGEAVAAGECLHERFARQAARRPGAVAVTCGGDGLTYGELDRRAGRLARRLIDLGVAPGDRVGLCAGRGLGLAVGILGILKAGAAYVPLDPAYPRERLAFLLKDAGAPVLVAEAGVVGRLPPWQGHLALLEEPDEETGEPSPGRAVPPGSPAYVIYTSGSTGRPKGVVVSHGNVLRLFDATAGWFGFGPDDVWTLFHSFAFDFSVWELWGALLYGGRLTVVPHEVSRSPEAFHGLLVREGVTVLNQTPSAFRPLIQADAEAPGRIGALRFVIFGGEALEPRSLAPWWRRYGAAGPALVNMYGITETTVHVTFRRLGEAEILAGGGSPIGVPIPDLRVYALDPAGRPAPLGVRGELYVGGAGVADGYLGRPELTAERFVPDPFGEPGARLYRSGDLGRWRAGGELEYLGRIDHQVKVRGFRIELGEIEAALLAHPAVREAVVLAREGSPGDQRLAAWVVGADGAAPGAGELRAFLLDRLPEHMVPAAFVPLPAIPLTPHGKVDRGALPAPGDARPELERAYAPPRTPTEEVLCAVWSQVLGVAGIGIHDNFFALGGDSILSIRAVGLAAERGLRIELPDLFRLQTVAELAVAADGAADGGDPLCTAPFSLLSETDRARLPEGLEDAYPLSHLQAGMLYHMALTPEEPLYHNVDSWHVRARFEAEPFREAVRRVVARHPILRTSFRMTGFSEPLQLVHRTAELPVEVEDLRGLPAKEQEREIEARIAREKRRLFDLERPPQLRFHVSLRAEDSFEFTLTENHAIFDGWSLHATLGEIFELYFALRDGRAAGPEPPPPLTYRDYVALERRTAASPEAAAFWEGVLDEAPFLELPRWPATAPLPGPRMRDQGVPLPPEVLDRLRGLAGRAAVPLKSVFLAAHLEVLGRLGGQPDVITGLVMNGRQEAVGGDQVRGLFLNTLPFRLDLEGGSWADLVRRVFARERETLPHRRYPFAAVQRRWGDRPLFDTAFNYIHFHIVRDLLRSGSLQVLEARGAEGASFKLFAHFMRDPRTDGVELHLEYDSLALHPAQAEAIGGCYARLLAAMAEAPEEPRAAAPLLSAAERHQILREWNDLPARTPGAATLPGLLAAQVERTPGAVALVAGGERLTYRDLDRRAERLARHLAALGVGPEVRVALCAERSAGLVVGLLGILKAGGAYVPLDPAYPRQRLAGLVEDSGAALLLVEEHLAGTVPEQGRRTVPLTEAAWTRDAEPRPPFPESLAYLIYTSGSTGRPKGVAIEHRSAAAFLAWAREAFSARELSGVLASTSVCFDLSVFELLAPLAWGGTVLLAANALELPELPCREEVRLVNTVPSALEELVRTGGLPASVRTVNLAGEPLPGDLVARLQARLETARVLNLYGPSEDTTYSTWAPQPQDLRLPPAIGRPLAGKRLYLLDTQMRPVPLGAAGEIWLGGHGLARGYLGRPAATAERFLPDPFSERSGERLYRTGDLGRLRPGGDLEFLGRIDHQVKLRGFRIELGEIDAVLAGHPAVRQVLTVAREDAPGDKRLVAYVVPDGAKVGGDELRAFLRERLPEPMVPVVCVLDTLPLLPNGKVDRRALPAPEWASGATYAAPEGPVEEALAEIWKRLLRAGRVGRFDNFFDLGGHSLLMMRLRGEIQQRFGREVSMVDMFRHTTVSSLAEHLDGAGAGGRPAALPDRGEELAQGKDRLRQRLRLRQQT